MSRIITPKFLIVFIVSILVSHFSFATVTITTTGTSGTNISADKAAGSVSPAYTTLNNIVIASPSASGDFATGAGSFVLTLPANWQLQAATGSVVSAGNITGTTISVTTTTVTVTYSCSGPSTANSITISGLQVQGTVTTTIALANITRTSGSGTITGFANGAIVGSLSQVAGAFAKLQLLLPGETAAPGTVSGKTGTPNAQTAGTAFTATVNGVDANWNIVTTATDNIQITGSDANFIAPANAALSAGVRTFSVTLKTAISQTLTATDVTNGARTANTSPSVTTNVGAFTRLQLLMPGETAAPGSATGKTGTATTPVTSGTSFSVTVNAVDANWNKVTSVTDVVAITSSDANATLPANAALVAGTNTYSVTLKTVGARTVTASDITDGTKTANTGTSITIAAGAFTKLQLLMPGETAAPGTATGKTGTPTAPVGAVAFNVIVNSVDANWNIVSNTDVIAISSTDAAATIPANAALVAGTKTFSVKLNTLGAATVTATDVTDGTKTANTSPSVTVVTGAFTKLQLLLPGETAAPGTGTGKTGTPTVTVAGAAFNITVNAVDANWYVITSATDVVGITSTDANAVLPANTALASGTQTFNIALKTAASKTITASDITTPAKTANTSPAVVTIAAAFAKMQLLMPGETASAGSATGKTGAPSARAAGTSFTVTVNAVDAYWNKVTTVTNTAGITTNDANATLPANAALVSGTKNFTVTLKTPTSTATVTATNITDGTKTANTSPSTVVNIGTFTRLQLLMPGETAAPGTASGKTGTPSARTAGTAFNVTVNAVDAAWNVVSSVTDVVKIASTDVNATLPANAALASGTGTFAITLKTSGTKTVTASDVTTPARTANTSPNTTVNTGAFVKLQLLLPGETAAAGTATGKTGTPGARAAGTAFTVTVNAVDANWNKVTTVTDVVGITSSDPLGVMPANAALAAGTKTNFTINLKTPGTQTVTATDITTGTITANTSPSVTVNIGSAAKLQLLMPGETAAPGTATGKTGTPTAPVAGVPFNVTVNAVDAAWNVVTSTTDVVKITSTDVNAVLPANAALVSGTKTFSVTLKTAGAKTVTATDVTNGTVVLNTSPSVTVATNSYTQLQVLLPGETAAPGTATGATGTANPPARGTSFTITVNAVDAYFNKVTTVTNTVTITSSDGAAVLPAAAALAAGTRNFAVTINSASTSPLPTITATSGAITKTVSVPVGITATAATDYFRTKTSGNWNVTTTWQSSTNGSTNWQDATLTPTNTANVITITNGNTVSVTASVTADQVVVDAGGQITVTSGFTFTIASGGAGVPCDVSGIINNAGTITPTGTLVFEAGSKYQHNFDIAAGTIPTATWNATSTCEIIGYTSYTGNMAGTNQTFGNVVWNCPGQNVAGGVFFGSTVTATMHDLSVVSTGSTGNLRLGNAAATSTITVTGDLNLSGGTLNTNNNASGITNLNIAGNFNQTGGTLQRTTGTGNITFNGSTTQNFIKTGGTISGNVNFAINSGAIADFGTYLLDGSSGTFTLNSGGAIITGNDDGLSASAPTGSIQNTGTRTFSTAANYTYDGDNAQNIGTGMPTTVNNLTIDNTQGVTMPPTAVSYTINGALSMPDGNLDMGTNNLLTGASFTNTGVGTLRTQSTSTTPFTAGKTWNMPVEYYGASAQTVVTGTYGDLSFSNAGTKTATTGTITVTGNWSSSNGKIDLLTNSTTVLFSGTTQTLDDDGTDNGAGVFFKNVTFGNSGTKTLNSGSYSVSASGLLTMGGSAILAANGNLTVKSDATSSANIGPITGSANITGNVNVESFITGGGVDVNRGTRSISPPIIDAALVTKIYQQLQAFVLISGPGGATNGFDVGGSVSPNAVTLQTYNEPPYNTGIYTPVPNIYQSVTPGRGFFLFFRGDRSNPTGKFNAPVDAPEDVTLTYTGPINKGDITVSGLTNTHNAGDPVNGYNLVGNPYPSAIDWETVLTNSTNMANLTVVVKAGGGSAQYLNGTGTNGGSRYIQPGQGFYAKVLDASNTGSVKFTESSKVTNAPARLLSLPGNIKQVTATGPVNKTLRVVLQDAQSTDETAVVFKTGYSETSVDDAPYFLGGTVSMGTLASDGRILAINFMPELDKVAQLKLSVNSTLSNTVNLSFTDLSALDGYTAEVKDNYLNKITAVTKNAVYSFAIDKNVPASFGTERLVMVFKKIPPVLPFQLLNFSAQRTLPGSKLSWAAKHEANNDHFEVERAADSLSFAPLGNVISIKDTVKNTYSFIDKSPLTGKNYYRLKQVSTDGTFSFSQVLSLHYTLTALGINLTAFPNPTDAQINIHYKSLGDRTIKLTVFNSSGFNVTTAYLKASNGVVTQDVDGLKQGIYFIEITDSDTGAFMGRVKFIKN